MIYINNQEYVYLSKPNISLKVGDFIRFTEQEPNAAYEIKRLEERSNEVIIVSNFYMFDNDTNEWYMYSYLGTYNIIVFDETDLGIVSLEEKQHILNTATAR